MDDVDPTDHPVEPEVANTEQKKKKKKKTSKITDFFFSRFKDSDEEKNMSDGEKKQALSTESKMATEPTLVKGESSLSAKKGSEDEDEEEHHMMEVVAGFSGGGYVQADYELDREVSDFAKSNRSSDRSLTDRSDHGERVLQRWTGDLQSDAPNHKRSSSGDIEGYDSSNSHMGKDSPDTSDRTSGYATSVISGVSYHGGSGFVATPTEVCIRRAREMKDNSSISDMDDEIFSNQGKELKSQQVSREASQSNPFLVSQDDIDDYEAYNTMMSQKKQGLRKRTGSDGLYRTSSEQNLRKLKKSMFTGSVQDVSRIPAGRSEGLDDLKLRSRDSSRDAFGSMDGLNAKDFGSRDTVNATAAVASTAGDEDFDTMSIASTTSISSRIKKGWKGKRNWLMKGFNRQEKTSPTKEIHAMPDAEVEQKYFKRNQKSGEASKKLKTQIWSSVVTIVLVEGKDLLPMDDNGYSDPYVKFRLGNEKYKSKYKAKTLNPSWLEQFDLHMFDDQTSHLEISVWDHDTAGKDDIMGRAVIDLSTLAREETHALEQPLEDGAGFIKMMLTISGTCGAESVSDLQNYIPNPRERENVIRKYGLANSLKNIRDVGWLQVKVIKAQNLVAADIGGKSDPFCVLELVNDRLQTQTEYKTLNPEWGKVFTFNVKDIHAVLEVTVYDEDRDKKAEFLGKVAIPILRIRRKDRRWYQLKDKKNLGRAKGAILLEMDFYFNHVKAAIRTFNPREDKYMQPEPKFKISIMKRNIDRVSKIADAAVESGKFIQSCFDWESKPRSITAFIVFLIITWNFELYMLPITLLIIFFKNLLVVHIVGNLMKDKDEDEYVDEEDDDDEDEKEKPKKQKEEKKSFKEKLQAVQEVCLQVQEGMDMVASMGERVKNTANWTVPWLSWLAVTIFFIGTFVLFYVPVRYLILAWGINKFTKKLRAPNAIPNNELLDYLSRVPSDKELMMFRELRPDPGIGSAKRKRTST